MEEEVWWGCGVSDSSTPLGYLFLLDGTAKSMREVWMALQDDVKGMSVFGRVMEGESKTQVGHRLEIRESIRYNSAQEKKLHELPTCSSRNLHNLVSVYPTGSTFYVQCIYGICYNLY